MVLGKALNHFGDIFAQKTSILQDCFLQKEARVCVSNAFVLEDSMYE